MTVTPYIVVMESEEYGRETFPRDSLRAAMRTIKRLLLNVNTGGDGVERVIGLLVNPTMAKGGESDGR